MKVPPRNESTFKWKPTLILAIAGLCSIVVINLVVTSTQDQDDKNDETTIYLHGLDVFIHYKNGTVGNHTSISYTGSTATVFAVTNATFSVSFDAYPNGYLVTSINGASGGWTYKVNGTSPGIAANLFSINNQSTIEWVQVS